MPNENANARAVSVTDGKLTITEQSIVFEGTLPQVQAKLSELRNTRTSTQDYLDQIDAQIAEYESYEEQLTP